MKPNSNGWPALPEPAKSGADSSAASWSGDDDRSFSLGDVFAALRRRKWLVLAVTTIATLGTAFALSFQPQTYSATAAIRIIEEPSMAMPLGTTTNSRSAADASQALQSQLLLVRGPEVIGPVVDQEGLRLFDIHSSSFPAYVSSVSISLPEDSSSSVLLEFGSSEVVARSDRGEARAAYGTPLQLPELSLVVPRSPGAGEAELQVVSRPMALSMVALQVNIGPQPGTNALAIGFSSANRDLAPRVVNAVVQNFQRVNSTTAKQAAARRSEFLEMQLAETDSLIALAQAELISFRNEQQVFGSSEQMAALASGMLQIEARRGELNSDLQIYRSLLSELERSQGELSETVLASLVSAPQLASNPMISELFTRRRAHQISRDSLTVAARRPMDDPDVQRLTTLISHVDERLLDAARSQIALLESRLRALSDLETRNRVEFRRLPAIEAEEQRLSQQVEALQTVASQLRDEHQRARIAEAVEPSRVEILAPALEAIPASGGSTQKVLLGMLFGLLLGGGSAIFLENLNTSIRRRQELPVALQIPDLGVIPPALVRRRRMLGRGRSAKGSGVEIESPAMMSEAYRMLRTNIARRPGTQGLNVLAVTSASSAEGKSTTAMNLAVSFAQQGTKVLLVDCDLWRSRLAQVLGVEESPGLCDVLQQACTPEASIHESRIENLDVLPCGSRPGKLVELLNSREMQDLLAMLRRQYELIILDTPPVLAVSDAATLASDADGVLMVIRAGKTERGLAQAAVNQLLAVGANVVGGVLNDPDAEMPRYGNSYYASMGEYWS